MKLQYFRFRGKTKHIRRTSKCWPCVVPSRPQQQLCGHVIPGVEIPACLPPTRHSPEDGPSQTAGGGAGPAGAEPHQWRRGRTDGGRSHINGGGAAREEAGPHPWGRGHTTEVNVPMGGGSRTPLQLSVLAFSSDISTLCRTESCSIP